MTGRGLLMLDDDPRARRMLSTIIAESRYRSLGLVETDNLDEALRLVKMENPQVVFLDPSVQDGAADVVRHIMRFSPKTAVVLVSQLKMFEIVYLAINAGCRGYLLKPVQRAEVLDLLDRLVDLGQETFFSSSVDLGEPIVTAIRYLEQHFAEPVKLIDVARLVYLSPSYFSRQFKIETQMTFVEYLNQLRITHAKRLLRMTELPIDMVAQESGFHSASYFTTMFRRMQGLSPSEYRRKFHNRLSGIR